MTETTFDWRKKVYMPATYDADCALFLDKYATNRNLTKNGLLTITEPMGETVPYFLCPNNVKRQLALITEDGKLPRSAFCNKRAYDSAQANMYVYGYQDHLDKAILQRKRASAEYLKRWLRDNPEKMKEIKRRGALFSKSQRSHNVKARHFG